MGGFDLLTALATIIVVGAGAIVMVVLKSREAERHRELQSLLHRSAKGKIELESHRQARKKSIVGSIGKRYEPKQRPGAGTDKEGGRE